MDKQDVLIIGAGMVGSAMAIALARRGITVTVIEQSDEAREMKAAYDGRTSAIAESSVRVFKDMGVWEDMLPKAEPILDIRVVDGYSTAMVHYDHQEVGKPFGYILPNTSIKPTLLKHAKAHPNVDLRFGTRIGHIETSQHEVKATLESGEVITASLLLAADGRFSKTRKALGIGDKIITYGQTAIVCTIAHTEPHHGLALERFLPAGPFALLPIAGNRSGVVWSEPEAMAAHMLTLPQADFIEELETRIGGYLGKATLEGACTSYPLGLVLAEHYVTERAALIGDAAHAIHPIAGQGVNLGYRDVALMAQILGEAKQLGLDIGSTSVLERYAQLRKTDVLSMSFMTDALNRLFSNDSRLLKAARRIGLRGVERSGKLKTYFMLHAMGLTGHQPDMLKERVA